MDRTVEAASGCDSEAARLLPWFATGRLDAEDAARVVVHLAECVTCRDDLEAQRSLHGVLTADDHVEYSPQPSWQKLMTRIDELDRELPVATTVEPFRAPAAVATHVGHGTVARWLVAALVVQTFGLALLGALHWGGSPTSGAASPGFRTLASAPTAPASAGAAVRVVFAPGTNVEQVAALLRDIDARIVDGPSPAGTYALALAAPATGEADPVAMAIGRLRADARIVFAEPIREDVPPVQ